MKIVEYYRPYDYNYDMEPLKVSKTNSLKPKKPKYIPVSKPRQELSKLVCKIADMKNCKPSLVWIKLKKAYSLEVLKESVDSCLDRIQFKGSWLDLAEELNEIEKLIHMVKYL